jgi:LuxR family maltose regulon positive regulatory protein
LAQYRRDHSDNSIREAIGLLRRLAKASEAGGRLGHLIEILMLQALAHQTQSDLPKALASLERALTLVEPEDYIRRFLDEGPDMERLLREAKARKIMPDYTGRLLSAFEGEGKMGTGKPPLPTSRALVEPLTERELEVLRLFKTELSGPEIARELVVGLSTIRTHTKSIYSKLNVNSRRAAVKRAEELGLI